MSQLERRSNEMSVHDIYARYLECFGHSLRGKSMYPHLEWRYKKTIT